jgi:hypothetical protein
MLRRTARTTSCLSTVVLALFYIGEGLRLSTITPKEWVGWMLFPIGLTVGLAVGWWREVLGGSIAVVSVAAFYLVYGWLLNGRLNQGTAFLVFEFPGFLFLLSGRIRPGSDASRRSGFNGLRGTS